MLTLLIALWFVCGFLSFLGVIKIMDGRVDKMDILGAVVFSFAGTATSVVLLTMMVENLGAFKFLSKRVW